MPPNVVKALRPKGRQWVWALSTAALVINALRYRQRLEALPVVASDPSGDDGDLGRFRLVTAEGVTFEPGAVAAAVAYADRHGLDALDLVPGDLDGERVLEFIRLANPETFKEEALAVGRSSGHAVLIDAGLLDRLDVKLHDGALEAADLAELMVDAKYFAPTSCDLALVPGLHAAPETPLAHRDLLTVVNGDENASGATLFGLGVLGAGLAAAPGWGALALLAYGAQPAVAAGETPLTSGLAPAEPLTRPVRSLARALRTAAASEKSRREQERAAQLDQSRAEYRGLLAAGTARFFLPPREACPWCGSDDLQPQVDTIDFAQQKPGRFHVDRCGTCGHRFSNPALSPEGFDFFYKDFYSGLFEHALTKKFQVDAPLYELRADIVRRNYDRGEPKLWLDVGTGHGHFPLHARSVFPETRFEALDMGEAVLTAERRGWVAKAHYGLLVEMSDGLAGQYDVVSMHHCLEHTSDPRDQVIHLKRCLRPGGYLSIEVPDPECYAGDLLKGWWGPWFQPQHQNMVPIGNLCAALRAEGFTIVATEREEAHEQFEATMAVFLRLNDIAPPPGLPWRENRPSDTAKRVAVFTFGAPLLAAAVVTDKLVDGFVRKMPNGPNAYRVLARLNDGGAAGAGPAGNGREHAGRVADAGPDGNPGVPGLSYLSGRRGEMPPGTTAPVTARATKAAAPAVRARAVASAPAAAPATAGAGGGPAWARALLGALGPAVGVPLGYTAPPRELAPDPLPETYGFQLGTTGPSALPPEWEGRKLVRLSGDRSNLAREAAAIGISQAQGLSAPTVRALLPLEGAEVGAGERFGLVTDRPSGLPMLELIGPHLNYFESVLAGFAHHHASLHNQTAGLAAPEAIPTVDLLDVLGRIDEDRYPAQVAWLRAQMSGPGPDVLCHGGYEPRCVSGPGPDTWDTVGGPGHGLEIANWRNAAVAEREYDVGLTLMAFWVAPMFVDHRALRAQFKMIRNKLASRYLRSYADFGQLDDRKVAFWQAFHAQRVIAQLNGAYAHERSPFLPPAHGDVPKGLEKELARLFRIVSARERRAGQVGASA
jgi:SAM-dependent methyltransferase